MNWVRDFTLNQGHNPPGRDVEDAPAAMRQEFIDLAFGLAEQNPHALGEQQIHRIICQSLGVGAAAGPYGGFRYAAGRDIRRTEWNRVYDLISRLWPEFERAALGAQYREGVNRILAAYGIAWDLSTTGRLERVLPQAAQGMVAAAFAELTNAMFAPALSDRHPRQLSRQTPLMRLLGRCYQSIQQSHVRKTGILSRGSRVANFECPPVQSCVVSLRFLVFRPLPTAVLHLLSSRANRLLWHQSRVFSRLHPALTSCKPVRGLLQASKR